MPFKRLLFVLSICSAITACGSPPKPAEPDGSSRVMLNDPERVAGVQEQVLLDRALLAENNRLKAEVDGLQVRLDEMSRLVRSALTLPPPDPIPYMPVIEAAPPAADKKAVSVSSTSTSHSRAGQGAAAQSLSQPSRTQQ